MTLLLLLLASILSAYHAWRRHRYYLHVYQLEGYKPNEYRQWLRTQPLGSILLSKYYVAAGVIFFLWLDPLAMPEASAYAGLAIWCLAFASARRYRSNREKKPLVFTARMKRLAVFALGIAAVILLAGAAAGWLESTVTWLLLGWLGADMLAPRSVSLAGAMTRPIEHRIQEGFKQQARDRLAAQRDTTVIGITGSYGKTSVKFAIAEVLAQQFNVLATPGSFNTPMGICKVINNDLKEWHQFLVLEMGARYRGDIRELCGIATPDVAVLTSVGVAHLETMGSEEGIVETKAELVECMAAGGPVIANGDDAKVLRIVSRASGPVTLVSTERDDVELFAKDIAYDVNGCRFTVVDKDGIEEVMQARLLGRHNVLNILLGLGVGRHFGLTLRQMKHAVNRLEAVPHRLQLRHESGVTVIDDAFNSNPVGARNAIEILSQFKGGTRFVVTPGMIELGDLQDSENRSLGAFMASHVDVAILVGERQTRPIQEGLASAGFDASQIHVVRSLFDAQRYLTETLRPGDVVLYENDLPDHYDEPT